MAYADYQDAVDLYGETYVLTSVDRDADGQPDTTSMTAACAQSSSLMDSYLAGNVTVPVTPVPQLLVQICVDIAIYRLCPDLTRTDEKRQRFEDALTWLRDFAKGVVTLPSGTGSSSAGDVAQVSTNNPARVFTRSKMAGIL